jgi:type VI protein secretion system component VasK
MRARLVEWLSREADPVRCARINGFSAQVAALQNTVQPLLDAVFTSGGKAHNGAALRGIFLTSARQEALSIDSLLPELSRRFAMPRVGMIPPDLGFDDEDHGYFIAGTFKDTIFKEAGLVGFHRKGHIGNPVKWAAAAALTVACLGVGYLVFQTFENETRWTTRGVETATQTKPITSPTTVAALSTITAALRRMDDLETAMKSEGPVLPLMGWAGRNCSINPHTSPSFWSGVPIEVSTKIASSPTHQVAWPMVVGMPSRIPDLSSKLDLPTPGAPISR